MFGSLLTTIDLVSGISKTGGKVFDAGRSGNTNFGTVAIGTSLRRDLIARGLVYPPDPYVLGLIGT